MLTVGDWVDHIAFAFPAAQNQFGHKDTEKQGVLPRDGLVPAYLDLGDI